MEIKIILTGLERNLPYKISIFGLGYVGVVSAACLADMGHEIIGVDINQTKIDLLNNKQSPIIEPKVEDLIAKSNLRATYDVNYAIKNSDISIVCVGTPSNSKGSINTKYLEKVCAEVGAVLAHKKAFHLVVVRSTIIVGTMRNLLIPILERASGKRAGVDFGVCNNPEFLREGSAVNDFYNPPKTVIGETDTHSGDILESIYKVLPAPIIRCPIEVAEMVKYADNAWHATKIVFANEIGNLCKQVGVDSHQVMDIFCKDTKLNISPAYLKPAFAFGGSCLPKDIRALTAKSGGSPLLNSLLVSNEKQIELGLAMIVSARKEFGKRIALLGISFKAETDDLRESPLLKLAEKLLDLGLDLKIYDRIVSHSKIIGVNKEYLSGIEQFLFDDLQEVISSSDIIVIGNNAKEFSTITKILKPEQMVIDLVRIKEIEKTHDNYQGICW